MDNFIYRIPTTVHFGKGQIAALGQAIKKAGGSRILLAYGGGSIKTTGIFGQVVAELDRTKIEYVELPGIRPNPPLEDVQRGIDLCREHDLDLILAVGGGSVIDACKAMAAGVPHKGEAMELLTGTPPSATPLPLGTVLTMAATGSEMNSGAVITAGDNHKKHVLFHPDLFPRFSILDPEYTFSLPRDQTAAGCADILSHCMEIYLGLSEGTDVQDGMNEGVMRAVVEHAPMVLKQPNNYDSRATIMWASSMALAGLQFMLGKPPFRFPVHMMGHELSSMYGLTHGVTLALVTPAWMRLTMALAPEHMYRFANLARRVFDVREEDDRGAASAGVRALEAWHSALGLPARLRDAGVERDALRTLARRSVENGPLGSLALIGADQAHEIFKAAW